MRATRWPQWFRAMLWFSLGSGIAACAGFSDISGPRPVESPVADVELTPTQITLSAGGSTVLLARVLDGSSQALTDRELTWSSSDTTVATVSVAGLVSAVRPGVARIAVSADGRSATATVTVLARAVASVQLSPTAPSLLVGGFVQLLAVPVDEAGAPLTDRALFWVSSDPRVAVVDITGLVNGLTSGVATITATSEVRSASVGVTVSPVPVASVQITPSSDSITVGQTTQLSAVSRDSAGGLLGDRVATWTTNAAGVATVSSTGVVLGIAPGSATISATSAGRTSTARIAVRPRPVGSVIVSPSQSALTVGQTVRLIVQITDANGTLLTGRPATFRSSSATVAQVESDGTVTANAPGAATMTVTSEGQVGTATVVVSPSPVASVRISPASTTLMVGAAARLTAAVLDAGGGTLSQRPVTWTSGAPSVFIAAPDGTVVGLAPGTGLVFAASEGRLATATITVRSPAVMRVDVSPASVSIIAGETGDLAVTVRDSAGGVLTGRAVEWRSGNNTAAIVSNTGRVRAIAPGSAVISATVDGVVGTAVVTVVPVPIATVGVALTETSIIVRGTTQATATARDAANNVLTGRTIVWTSSNPAVATVSAAGLVTALTVGATIISAASEGKSGSALLAVTAVPVAAVSVSLAVPSVTVGGTTQATAVTTDAASNVLSGRSVVWSSSNTAVATVSSTGLVTALSVGTSLIAGTSEGRSGSAVLTVSAVPVATVSVSLAATSVTVGGTTQATATARDAANNVLTGRPVAWASSNPAVAMVSGAGLVTSLTVGTATITATSEGRSGTAVLAVTAAPVATVTVSLAATSVTVGGTTQATAVTRDAVNTVLTGRAIAWSSSNTSVATVNSSGLVTALAVGSATITATSEGRSGTGGLTVTAVPVASVSASLAPTSVAVGATSQATAVTRDASNNVLAGRTVTWSSSNTAVATVNSSGLVTTLAVGTATITATSEGQIGNAVLTVTAVPVASVSVSLAASSLTVGATSQATAVTRDASNKVLTGRTVTWSSSNTAVATVNSSGLVTALDVGTATITATSEGQIGNAVLTVTAVPVASVSVSLAASSLTVGATTQATAVTRDASNNVLAGRTIVWSSSNTAVATVSVAGVVAAVGAGTATITATSETQSGTAVVTVPP